jgi:hypothetical protein
VRWSGSGLIGRGQLQKAIRTLSHGGCELGSQKPIDKVSKMYGGVQKLEACEKGGREGPNVE